MEVIAKSKNVGQTPRKLGLVARALKGLNVKQATEILEQMSKKAAQSLLNTLKQGVGNAVNNFKLNEENLRVKNVQITKGPMGKRWQAVSRGRAHMIQRKTSNIKILLEGEVKETLPKAKKVTKLIKKEQIENGTKS